ncbi:MAG: calcium-binding protein [Sulfitobacter sp.]|nr:calcium-binding protein [Sulfitobacter sp.]
MKTIGQVTAVIAEATTATRPGELADGRPGNTAFPYVGALKAIATVGEVDAETGHALTGYPDGHAAWLANEETVRVVYQSESYATMSSETYGWEMQSGVTFTGSHIHAIDYDRAGLADLLASDAPAASVVKGSEHLFNRIYNVFGDEVLPRSRGGRWGNQTLANGTLIDFADSRQLSNGDFFFQSFCGAYYEPVGKYGDGVGFADDIWLTAEEWKIQRMFDRSYDAGETTSSIIDANWTMGLASVVVDIDTRTAYTVPAMGQTGYEKILPINPQHPDYVVLVLAGYNHDLEPAPLKIYIGRKGLKADGTPIAADAPARDRFLARNGLLHGKIYGMAVANETYPSLGIDKIDTSAKMMDAYITNPEAPGAFDVAFVPTSYQWGGWDKPVAVAQTEMALWQRAEEQPEGHTYFVGDSKTEHPAVDPDLTRTRWVQNLTNKGGMLAIELANLADELAAADGALPAMVSGSVIRMLGAYDGALSLEVAEAGLKHGGEATHATWEDGRAQMVAPDGLQWIKASDADVLIVDEDSGNEYGERKFALVIDPDTMQLTEQGKGYFLAMAGGKLNPRAEAGVSALGGAFSRATSSEFSGSWDVTALLARKEDGSFYRMEEIVGTGEQEILQSIPLKDHILIGVVQHRGESGGQVAAVEADQGGQIFLFKLALPEAAFETAMK